MAQQRAHHFSQILLADGWARDVRIVCTGGVCASIAIEVPASAGDERHTIGIPGLPNLHSHAFQRGMAGLAERRGLTDDSFWTWRDVMYRFVDRIRPEDLQAIAALAFIEMLESGFTRVGEFHYLHHDIDGIANANLAIMAEALVAAAHDTGIALTLLPVFYAHSGFGGLAPQFGQRRFICDLEQFGRLLEGAAAAVATLPDGIVGVAPHSLRAVTADELKRLLTMSPTGPVHIHIAEQIREVEDCVHATGVRPVEWLLDTVAVDERWCLVHATHMTDDEARRLAATGAVAGLCPITEANLGDGIFNAGPFLSAGGRYGIGSDSNILIDATEELRWLEYGQRLADCARNCLSTGQGASTGGGVFATALAGGGQALGASSTLAVGAPLDFLTLTADHPSLADRTNEDILDSWIFAAGRCAIDSVWRRGERVVSEGAHRYRPRIEQRYRGVVRRLLA
ncbi:formiminoglutamate deiminase [Novosphingobium sp. SG751A]|uniref:formimidoylglutamate deiminase n=1 Tax=Novosphingobium sp. SG751A TaxID=2587000 RepID=UPI0015579183|nr:formimidoylglutamate deiminase [Novosphingobium sp. SG751A]NOW44934.1 formiminoglutamate deiminase [Novosphingobium sp. SG751A]